MPRSEHSIVIERPRQDVFAVLSDVRNTARWHPSAIEETWITPGPIGLGSRRRSVGRAYGATTENVAEVSVFEPPSRLGLRSIESPVAFEITIDLESLDGRTQVRWVSVLSPTGFLRFVVAATARLHERQTMIGLERLRALMEDGTL